MAALSTITDDFSSGSLNGTRWPSTYAASGGSVSVVSGAMVVNHNYDGTVPGWPPPDTGVWGQTGEIANSSVYCRFKPLLTDDNGAGNAFKANDIFAVMNQANLEGFGFLHTPADGTNGSLYAKIFNNIDDEWWVDVGTISSYNPNGDHAWLRVRHSGTTFYWDTAPDNGSGSPGTWTNRFSYSQTGTNVSFDSMSGFLGTNGACIHYRAYHWEDTFSEAIVLQDLTIDGVNSALVASVTHAATGALTGPGSTLAGSAARTTTHGSSGALVGPGAALAGSAAILRVHEADGALAGPGAVLAGSAFIGVPVEHVAEGALAPALGAGAVLIASAALTPDPDKVHSVQDFFDGAFDTAKWTSYVLGGASGSVSQSGGELQLSLTSNGTGHNILVEGDVLKDFEGSHVYARMTQGLLVSGGASGGEAIFGVLSDADSGYGWHQQSTGRIQAVYRVAGVSDSPSDFAYTPSTHAWLRIREAGGTIYWDRAPSTAQDPPAPNEWVNVYSRPRSSDGSFAINAMRIRFMVNYWGGAPGVPNGPVKFASVNTRTVQVITHDATGDLEGPGASLAGAAALMVTHDATGALEGPGAALAASASRSFEHTAVGALVGEVGSAIIGQGTTSDLTRHIWVNTQDTGGAWTEPAQSDDPWTPRDDTGGGWAS